MDIKSILEIAIPIATFVLGLVPTLIGLCAAIKAKKRALNDEERVKADAAIEAKAMELIAGAEKLYHGLNGALKANGTTAGLVKKDSVLSQLQNFAAESNFNFDREAWSQKIDELVAFTKEVNHEKAVEIEAVGKIAQTAIRRFN